MPRKDRTVRAGVIGVGNMGRNHTRVYAETPRVDLVGVNDADEARARMVAADFGTEEMDRSTLLESVDVASVAVPTEGHFEVVMDCIEHGVDVLVEKPFVSELDQGRELSDAARSNDVVLQIGHIERFNPATRVLAEIVPDLDVVSIDANRLGPPVDRESTDTVVMDLMVHDLDILLSLVSSGIASLSAVGMDGRHVSAQVSFEDGTIATISASRLTQEKVRQLSVTAMSCRVNVDFIDQSVEIHRRYYPEFVESDGDVRYRHESVVERPLVERGEPLKSEIGSFIDAVQARTEPVVRAEEALEVLQVADRIESAALGRTEVARP